MGMGCCRPSRAATARSGSRLCDVFEQQGANSVVWPINTTGGLKILTKASIQDSPTKLELFSFLKSHKCNGPTCRWILRQEPAIVKAIRTNPQKFAKYASSGITIIQLSKICRSS